MVTQTLNQRGFINVPVGSTPVALSDYLPTTSRWHHALIGVSGGAVRWLAITGDNPTASYGSYVGAGGQIDWTRPETDYAGLIYAIKFIAVGAPANLECALFW